MSNATVHQLPGMKALKKLLSLSFCIGVFSVALIVWTYRPEKYISPLYFTSSKPQISVKSTVAKMLTPGYKILQGEQASLVPVNMTKTLMISAFMEHRAKAKEVRVLAIVLRSEKVEYCCHLLCQEELHVSKGSCNIHSDHFGFPYGTAGIMCPVPQGCKTPSRITLTSTAERNQGIPDEKFLEVKNQYEKNDTFTYNFTVCFSTMFNYTNTLQLVQSLELLKLLGVNRVVAYKTNCSAETQLVLDYYTRKGLVEVIPWSLSTFLNVSRSWLPKHGPGELHYYGQIPALNDCLYRSMYTSRYVAMHDTDELILPLSVNSWLEMLPLLEQKFGADKCYMFENNVFPSNLVLPFPGSESLSPGQACWDRISGRNILAHLYQEPVVPDTRYNNFKIIGNPRSVFSTSVHGVLESRKGCSWVDRNMARIYHTRTQRKLLTPNQLIYDGRLLTYSSRLTPAVNRALKESGLLLDDGSC